MTNFNNHHECLAFLKGAFIGKGLDYHITPVAPLIHNDDTLELYCPHEVTFYAEPTGEQLAKESQGRA